MGKRDISTVMYFQDEDRFADLLNGYVFGGRQMVAPEDIQEVDSRVNGVFRRMKERFLLVKYRDGVRRAALGTTFVVVGLEHQDKIHYAMPVRVLLADAASYSEQLRKLHRKHRKRKDLKADEFLSGFGKDDRLEPVITLVLYYGQEPWDGARDLYQMMGYEELPEEIRKLVNNYPIHVLEVRNYPDTEQFQTDLREVFGFIQRSENRKKLVEYLEERRERFEDLDEEAYDMIMTFSSSEELEQMKESCREEGGRYNMCKALKDWAASERAEGREEGRAEGRAEGEISKSAKTAGNLFRRGIPLGEVAEILEESTEQVQKWYDDWKGN